MSRKKSQRRSKRRKSHKIKKKSPNNWRWNFIKNVVTRKRGTLWSSRDYPTHGSDMALAKKMLNSPVRDLTKYPKVMRWLKTNKVYISMTCSPKRLSKVQAVLASINSKYLETLYLVLPHKFGRSGELYNSTLIKRIEKNTVIITPKKQNKLWQNGSQELLKSLGMSFNKNRIKRNLTNIGTNNVETCKNKKRISS